MSDVFATVSQADYDRITAKLQPGALTDGQHEALERLALNAEREIKARTPVRTGTLQRSIASDLSGSRDALAVTRVWTDLEYANPVESWAQMFSDGAAAAIEAAGDEVAFIATSIEKRWTE